MHELCPIDSFQPRKSSRRDPWNEDEAREVLGVAGQSGLSLSAFARRHGLSDRTQYWWRLRTRAHPSAEAATASFVRIFAQAQPNRELSGVEVVVGDAVVRVAPVFCAQTLVQVVAALRPC